MADKTYYLCCTGNTYAHRATLAAARFWKWSAKRQAWIIELNEHERGRIIGGDTEFLKGLGGCLKGCRLTIGDAEVWRSKSYGVTAAPSVKVAPVRGEADPEGWNRDGRGYYVGPGKQIPGSAPGDCY